MIQKGERANGRKETKTKETKTEKMQETTCLQELRNLKLLYAAARYDSDRVLELLGEGADPNIVDDYGNTPLMVLADAEVRGCCEGRYEANLLIQFGADVNKCPKNGEPPLMLAAWEGKADFVKLLLENGANVNAHTTTENDLRTALDRPLDYLEGYSDSSIADQEKYRDEALRFQKVARLLMEHGGKRYVQIHLLKVAKDKSEEK
jgi:hypothetical protein